MTFTRNLRVVPDDGAEPAAARPPSSTPKLRVAIAHDFLVERGGAERVLVQLARSFPGAPIHTALCRPQSTYGEVAGLVGKPLVNDPFGLFAWQHRSSLPFAAQAFRSCKIDADVLIVSSSGLAHLAQSTGHRIIYCHTPARWLHKPDEYFRRLPASARKILTPAFRKWLHAADLESMRSADVVLVNSDFTAAEVQRLYGRRAQVIHPVSSMDVNGSITPIRGIEPGFILTPSRLLGYKRLDVLLDAARRLPEHRFLIVGHGPLLSRLRRQAPSNVHVAGGVSESTLRWAYRECHAVALTSADDYGLVPDEAAAFGKLAITPLAGGYLEQHSPGASTSTYRFADVSSLCAVLKIVGSGSYLLPCHDLKIDRDRFDRQIHAVVTSLTGAPDS